MGEQKPLKKKPPIVEQLEKQAEENYKKYIRTKEYIDRSDKSRDVFDGLSGILEGKIQIKPRTSGRVSLELAPNAVKFIEADKYLDGPELKYPQYMVVRDFFELLCPFCNDIEKIRDVELSGEEVIRDEQVLFEYNLCPKCGFNKLSSPQTFSNFNELIGVVGMRGGKSVLVACMSAYILHELLCIEGLQEKLELVRSQIIEGAFVAASGEQASETIYGHFRGFYENSPWFQDYRKRLMDLEITDPDLRRGDLYWETDRNIFFKDKRIQVKSLTSNSGSIAGKTRIFTVIDELSRMEGGESRRSATEVYRVLKRSLITIKAAIERLRAKGIYDIPEARMFCISSPMFEDDKSMQLLKQAQKTNKMFAFHRTTWEFNPDITREDLAEEYALDPVGAERDYGANPPGAENPFIQNKDLIEICIDRDRPNFFTIRERFFEQEVSGYLFKYVAPEVVETNWRNLIDYVVHCDPGERGDSFCLAIGHKEDNRVIIDGAIECRPIPKNNRQRLEPREVYFAAMSAVIKDLAKRVSIRYVSYDRWNSTEHLQELRRNHILAFKKDIDRSAYVKFLGTMMSGNIRFPMRENEILDPAATRNMPCAKAIWELKRLEDDGVGVHHSRNASDDMIQCYVGVHRLLIHPEDVINMREVREVRDNNQRGRNSFGLKKIGKVVHLGPRGVPKWRR